MPYRRRASSRMRPIINSIKNQVHHAGGVVASTTSIIIAKAVNTPLSTENNTCSQGSVIKAIWISLDICGLAGSGVANSQHTYIIKNPGNNLTNPSPKAWGTSNEKKFIFKSWTSMIMRNQDGNLPFHWEGWIKVPKRYQRMGIDDTFQVVFDCTAAVTGIISFDTIYKWYS